MIRVIPLLATIFALGCFNPIYNQENTVDNMTRQDGINPDGRLGGWSVSGVINPPHAANPLKDGSSSISLQCQLAKPGIMTVEFEISASSGAEGFANIPVATIEWSTNGSTVRRKVSVINGMSISGTAEYVRVKIEDESESVDSSPYTAAALVTPGPRGGDVQPTLQNQPDQTAPHGNSATFTVPQDAGVTTVRALIWDPALGVVDQDKILIFFLDIASNPLNAYQNPTLSGFVHLPPGTTFVQVINQNAQDVTAHMIFGVDG